MATSITNYPADESIASALVGAYAGSVPARPVLPEGLREGVIALLAGLMADPERLDAYAEALAAELERRGLRAALLRSGGAGLDLPGDRIAADGFAGLPDGLLADIALSPEAIAVLGDHLHEPATRRGGWFVDAVLEAHASRAEDREPDQRNGNGGSPESGAPTTLPLGERRSFIPSTPVVLLWGGRMAALAASLLIGVFLGSTMFREGREGTEVLIAVASPIPALERGGYELQLEIRSPFAGFATIVCLGPGLDPEVLPVLSDDDLAVSRGGTELSPILPGGTTQVLLIITVTPATEPIRALLRGKAFPPGQLEALQRFLRPALEAKGYRRMAFGATSVSRP